MQQIQKYIFRRAFVAFLMCLCSLIGVVWLTQILGQLDLVTDKGQSLGLFFQMTWLILPKFVAFIAPVAVLLATIFTLQTLSASSEWVIMASSGIAPMKLVRPLLALAVGVMIVDFAIAHYFSPKAQRQVRAFITQINADLIQTVIKPGQFAKLASNITFYTGERTGDGTLKKVFVVDGRNAKEELTYLAELGQIISDGRGTYLVLQEGTIHRTSKETGGVSVIDYTSYAFDLSTFQRKAEQQGYFHSPSEQFTTDLIELDPKNPAIASNPGRFIAELHNRFAAPLYSVMYVFVIFTFLGKPRTTRQDQVKTIAAAFFTVLGLRTLGIVSVSLSESSAFGIGLQYAIPIVAILVSTYLIFKSIQPSLPPRVQRIVSHMAEQIEEKYNAFRSRQLKQGAS